MNANQFSCRRLNMTDDDVVRLQRASEHTGLSQTEILSQLVRAGLGACEAQGYRLLFPLRCHFDGLPAAAEERVKPRRAA
jgi:hypothetical protein